MLMGGSPKFGSCGVSLKCFGSRNRISALEMLSMLRCFQGEEGDSNIV